MIRCVIQSHFHRHNTVITVLLVIVVVFSCHGNEEKRSLSEQIKELLRNRIESAGIFSKISVSDEIIHSSIVLPRFYERREFQPAWINDSGPSDQVQNLIESLHEADREGLKSEDYHLERIVSTLQEIEQNQTICHPLHPGRLVDLELLCTDAFLIYSSHLLVGRVNPETIDAEWLANRREADLAEILETALTRDHIQKSLEDLLPNYSGYKNMRNALDIYNHKLLDGGWPVLTQGAKIQVGDSDERVPLLRERLVASDDLAEKNLRVGIVFDEELGKAVHHFQKRHGLDPNGCVDQETLAELNVPIEERIRQLIVNMERWRWLPNDLGKRYILVNIANFELNVVEDDQVLLRMKVITGKPYRRTVVFSDKITYLVLCPYWHVPPGIAVKDILPAAKKDTNYLSEKKIRIFQGWGADVTEIDPKQVDWPSVSPKNFPYRFRQDPGPNNALGRIKFMFPNKFKIYLHDTPSRELFDKTERAFSSGCIRIENPIELAEYLLRDSPKWDRERIITTIHSSIEQTVPLPEPISIHVLYWTVWADDSNTIHFQKDIYERDKRLEEALLENPPHSQ